MRAIPASLVLLTASCSMMHDDLPQCAIQPQTRTAVHFIYDYNTTEEDLFSDLIGSVTLYVFDQDGKLVKQVEHTASSHELKSPGYTMMLDLPAGDYTFYASARESENGYEASLNSEGAKFRRSGASLGVTPSDIFYTLDHNNGVVEHQNQPLEHFWLTLAPQPFTVTEAPIPAEGEPQPDDVVLDATVALQRVTNNLHIEIIRGEDHIIGTKAAQKISPDDYNVWIETANGVHKIDLTANPADDASPLTYTPHAISAATTANNDPCVATDFSLSRLIYSDDAAKHDRLYVYSKTSGKTFEYDLTNILETGHELYSDKSWSHQEYLDRQDSHTMRIEFNEDDTGWRYVELYIAILNWSKRIQNVEFN